MTSLCDETSGPPELPGLSLSDFPSTGSAQYDLATFLTIVGTKVPGSDAATKFELVAGADPYFTNIDTTPGDPNQNNVFYLSQDLRVFAATFKNNVNNVPVTGGPQFKTDSVAGAFTYIQDLLTFLNANYNDPNVADPFTTVLPSQAGALQGDSSVTPLTVDFSNPFNPQIYNNYNFAVARVRLLGPSGSDPGRAFGALRGRTSDALFSAEVQFFLNFLIAGWSPDESATTDPRAILPDYSGLEVVGGHAAGLL
jgi:hypothetical protein